MGGQAQTTVEKQGEEWVLLVDGSPFEIKGVTFGYDQEESQYDRYFQDLTFLGVNTIRTWGTDAHTGALLDAAHRHGFKVMLGIWMRHGRPGMEADDSFDYLRDKEGKQAMFDNAIETVNAYKDHPAILTWGIGNEVYLNMATDPEKIAYSKLLEKICKKVKKIDPHHPITSVEAWTFGADWWPKYVPSLDIYGINTYGVGANFISAELAKKGVDKPYVITEFGVRGEWEIEEDRHGVKPEPSDAEKYETIVKGYQEWIQPKPNCLGVYVFHYATDDHFGAVWLLTHFRGLKRPQYWAIREAYTGQPPVNQVPVIHALQLAEEEQESGAWIPVQVEVSDPEQEEVILEFYYNQRTGSRRRRDQLTPLKARGSLAQGLEVQLPSVDGGIKVYVTAADASQNIGIASTSISVRDEAAARRKYLVPQPELPFYVYRDGEEQPYVASAFMGNQQALSVEVQQQAEVYAGKAALKITYTQDSDWYGVGLVDPANDWGSILGGYDLSGAKSFTFWAKASQPNVTATIGFGLIGGDQPFPDTDKKALEVELQTSWKKYVISTHLLDLSCIRSGLTVFSSGKGSGHEIFIDEVRFE
jgi:hypothetical protein